MLPLLFVVVVSSENFRSGFTEEGAAVVVVVRDSKSVLRWETVTLSSASRAGLSSQASALSFSSSN